MEQKTIMYFTEKATGKVVAVRKLAEVTAASTEGMLRNSFNKPKVWGMIITDEDELTLDMDGVLFLAEEAPEGVDDDNDAFRKVHFFVKFVNNELHAGMTPASLASEANAENNKGKKKVKQGHEWKAKSHQMMASFLARQDDGQFLKASTLQLLPKEGKPRELACVTAVKKEILTWLRLTEFLWHAVRTSHETGIKVLHHVLNVRDRVDLGHCERRNSRVCPNQIQSHAKLLIE
jgi:hypothetical protein